jgi:hypothetical protein
MTDKKRLAELFSVAHTTNQYGSVARHLPAGVVLRERDLPTRAKNSSEEASEQNANQQKLHYSYGL